MRFMHAWKDHAGFVHDLSPFIHSLMPSIQTFCHGLQDFVVYITQRIDLTENRFDS